MENAVPGTSRRDGGKVRRKGNRIRNFNSEIGKNRTLYLMVLPTLFFFMVFAYAPLVGLYYAFINFNFVGGLFGSPFVGLKNFEFLFFGGAHAIVWRLTINTVLYNLAFIFIGNGLQCFTAIVLNDMPGKFFKRTTQSVMLLPYFVSYVIVGAIAYSIFNYELGSLNSLLHAFGLKSVNIYMMPTAWKYILVFFNSWKGLGYGTIIYLAAIMGIGREMYEAADLDGCNVFQQIRYITLPLLKPTFIMLVLFSLGGIMRGQFDLFYQLVGNNGLLFNATDILDTYIYRSLVINFNVSTGTAAGLYQSIFGLAAVLIVNTIIRKINSENALF
jgi:putative aldouronate transport system permease protein